MAFLSRYTPFFRQETEEPIVECQECETEVSPSQTGGSSGDLGDISSFSSKASSLHRTSSGTSLSAMHSSGSSGRGAGQLKGKTSGTEPAEFALPSSRGGPGKLRCRQGLQRESHRRGRVADVLISWEKGSCGKSPHPPRIDQLLFHPFSFLSCFGFAWEVGWSPVGGRLPEKLWKTGEGPRECWPRLLPPAPHFLQPVGVLVGSTGSSG